MNEDIEAYFEQEYWACWRRMRAFQQRVYNLKKRMPSKKKRKAFYKKHNFDLTKIIYGRNS